MTGGNQNKRHDELVAEIRAGLEVEGALTLHLTSYTVRFIAGRFLRLSLNIEKGWPDIICFRPSGKVEFYEVKTGEAKPNPDQRLRFSELVSMGYTVTITRETLNGNWEVQKWKNEKKK